MERWHFSSACLNSSFKQHTTVHFFLENIIYCKTTTSTIIVFVSLRDLNQFKFMAGVFSAGVIS